MTGSSRLKGLVILLALAAGQGRGPSGSGAAAALPRARGPWGLQQRAGEARGRAAGAAAAAQVPPLLQSLPWPLPGTEGWVRRRGAAKEASSELRRRRGGGGGDSWRVALSDGIRNGCASGLAAACAKLLLQPFDTVKTVQQATRGSLGMLEAGRQLVARKGVGALYSGLGITLVGSIPAVSVYFGCYQYSKKLLLGVLPPGLGWSLFGIAVSAGMGNTVASVFRVPYEVVKQRLQAGVYATTGEALRTMWVKEGGLWAFFGRGGVTSQILRDVPYAIVTLLTYEMLHKLRREHMARQHMMRQQGEEGGGRRPGGSSSLQDSLIGAVAGGVGTFLSNPMDVVKTRVMTQPHLYTGVLDAALKTYRGEGASAFFKGSVPRLLHKIPANAIFFAAYELFRALLGVSG